MWIQGVRIWTRKLCPYSGASTVQMDRVYSMHTTFTGVLSSNYGHPLGLAAIAATFCCEHRGSYRTIITFLLLHAMLCKVLAILLWVEFMSALCGRGKDAFKILVTFWGRPPSRNSQDILTCYIRVLLYIAYTSGQGFFLGHKGPFTLLNATKKVFDQSRCILTK